MKRVKAPGTAVNVAVIGFLGAAVGFISGIVLAAHRVQVGCPDGYFIPEGGDPNCYSHPNAGVGVAAIGISVALAVIIGLAVYTISMLETLRAEQLFATTGRLLPD